MRRVVCVGFWGATNLIWTIRSGWVSSGVPKKNFHNAHIKKKEKSKKKYKHQERSNLEKKDKGFCLGYFRRFDLGQKREPKFGITLGCYSTKKGKVLQRKNSFF